VRSALEWAQVRALAAEGVSEREIARRLGINRCGGDIVNLSSVAARIARARFALYAATKWGMNGWSESLRL
jgi:short-subunit dehydrogenase